MSRLPAPLVVLAGLLGLLALLLALRLIGPSEYVPTAKFCAVLLNCPPGESAIADGALSFGVPRPPS